jgi:hypothetical protein
MTMRLSPTQRIPRKPRQRLSLIFAAVTALAANHQAALGQSAVVTNNSNPSSAVSTNTTGGTNINYQTNNQWSNDNGFAPGIFCRTPTFYVGGSTGQNLGNTMDTFETGSYQYTHSYSANMGILLPFGSTVQRDCKRLAEQIAKDREISSDLSMIRACASLDNEGIIVDPSKFPTLSRCVINPGQPPLTVSRAKALQAIQAEQRQMQRTLTPAPKTEIIKN